MNSQIEKLNAEIKKVVTKAKDAQGRFHKLMSDQSLLEEAKKYADKQRKEVRKILTADVTKVRTFLEKERAELERFQKQIPSEVKKIRGFVIAQQKELKKLLTKLSQASKPVTKKAGKARRTRKKAGASTSSSSSSSKS
jgi:thiamine kinase-like enzyme